MSLIDIDKIKPYEKNPRKNDNAVDAVAKSIKEFGFVNPIIVDSNNIIIAGHTRLKAAKKLGLKEVPTKVVKDLTPAQANALRIADNKTAEIAEWDMDLLAIEIEDLKALKIDVELTGFSEDEIKKMSIGIEPQGGGVDTIDESWGIYIECSDESEQQQLLEKLMAEGVKCKALIS